MVLVKRSRTDSGQQQHIMWTTLSCSLRKERMTRKAPTTSTIAARKMRKIVTAIDRVVFSGGISSSEKNARPPWARQGGRGC